MPIEIPTLDELHTRLVDAGKAAFPTFDVSRFSDFWKRLRVNAGLGFQLNHHIAIVADDVLPDTAVDEQLDRHGLIYDVSRKLATPARKADALRLVGTVAATFTIGDELVSQGGLRFQLNESGSIPAGGFIDVDVVAIDVGSQTQLNAGEVLSFVAAPAGLETEAELQLDLDEDGTDRESNGAYRVRILNKIQQPGMGGNSNDWAQWLLEEQGVASAYVWPLRRGKGSVDVAALHSGRGTVRPLTLAERNTLTAAVDLKRPVSLKLWRLLETLTTNVDIELTITPALAAQYRFDWDDSGVGIALHGATPWTGATRTLKFLAARPTDMVEGDRLTLSTPGGSGEQFTIERFGAAADEVIIDKTPSPVPTSADTAYAGGPLVDPVRDALLAFMDALGPGIGTTGVGNWEDRVVPGRLEAIALSVSGVSNSSTIVPASTTIPTEFVFPADGFVSLLIPRQVIVRKAP